MTNQASTSIDQLIQIVQKSGGNNQILNNLIKTLHKTIPVVPKRRKSMSDTNLNKTFRIKRINYSVIATVTHVSPDNLYTARILSVDGQSFNKVGDDLTISKRELEITGRVTSSLH